ncbi:MAG: phosphotransferase [candidate division NC10 bacterium]
MLEIRLDEQDAARVVRLAGRLDGTGAAALDAALATALADESPRAVACLAPHTPLRRARAWVYLPRELAAAADRRVRIQVRGGGDFPDEWEVIAGCLYRDCTAVTLTPLTGGYSAATFQAASTDREGRRLLPTVLKISSLAFTDREERAYHAHVRPFILNNSAVIMGRATHGSSAGLKYNFLGIAGPDTRLSSLGDHVAQRPVAELAPILDALCLRILWPWYGQARDERIRPFVEHEPRGLFPGLVDDAARHLGVSPDTATIPCPELGRPLPNPYRALRYDYPARRDEAMAWRTSITHGDLNLNNVLLDEKENLYVIDFSETARRNAVADFARLEALLVLQTTRLTDERDFRHLVEFVEGLLRVATLGQSPPLVYRGDDPAVEKAYHLVCLLRGYAAGVAPPSGALLPYLLPLLQWTLPLVSFRQLETPRRRLSMMAAALAWERLGEA